MTSSLCSKNPSSCHVKFLSASQRFFSRAYLAIKEILVEKDLFVLHFRRTQIQEWINNNWSFENSISSCSLCGLATRPCARERSVTWRLWIPEIGNSAHKNEEEGQILLRDHITECFIMVTFLRITFWFLQQLVTNLFL